MSKEHKMYDLSKKVDCELIKAYFYGCMWELAALWGEFERATQSDYRTYWKNDIDESGRLCVEYGEGMSDVIVPAEQFAKADELFREAQQQLIEDRGWQGMKASDFGE